MLTTALLFTTILFVLMACAGWAESKSQSKDK